MKYNVGDYIKFTCYDEDYTFPCEGIIRYIGDGKYYVGKEDWAQWQCYVAEERDILV